MPYWDLKILRSKALEAGKQQAESLLLGCLPECPRRVLSILQNEESMFEKDPDIYAAGLSPEGFWVLVDSLLTPAANEIAVAMTQDEEFLTEMEEYVDAWWCNFEVLGDGLLGLYIHCGEPT